MNMDSCEINFIGLTHDHTSQLDNVADSENGASSRPDTDELCSAISILKRHPKYDCLVLVKKYRHCLDGYALEFPVDRVRDSERIPTNESAKHNTRTRQVAREQEGEDRMQEAPRAKATGGSAGLSACSQRRLVSRFLDGDDPMYSPSLLYTMSSHSISAMHDASDDDSSSSSRRQQQLQQQQQQQHLHTAGGSTGVGADDASNASENEMATSESVQEPFMKQIDDKGDQCDLVHVPVNGLMDRLELYTRNGIAVDSRVYAFAMGLKTAERMMTTKSMKELQETPI